MRDGVFINAWATKRCTLCASAVETNVPTIKSVAVAPFALTLFEGESCAEGLVRVNSVGKVVISPTEPPIFTRRARTELREACVRGQIRVDSQLLMRAMDFW